MIPYCDAPKEICTFYVIFLPKMHNHDEVIRRHSEKAKVWDIL